MGGALVLAGSLWAGLLLGWGRVGPAAGAMMAGGATGVLLAIRRARPRAPPARSPHVAARVLGDRERVLAAAGFLPGPGDADLGRPRRARALVLAAATVLLGLGWAGLRLGPPASLGPLEGRSVSFSGAARSDPRTFPTGWGLEARIDRAGERQASLRVWVSGRGAPPALAAGDRLGGSGSFRGVVPDDGFEGYLADRGVDALVSASELVREGPPRSLWLRVANSVRDALAIGARRALPRRQAGLLLGLTIGETRGMHPEIVEDFRATGLGHLVAVSGSNVVMVLAPVLGLAALAGMGPRGRMVAGGLAVVLFALITRWEPSVLRASAMAGLALLGVAAGRPRETAGVLAWAVVILLLVDPRLARSLAFQLSAAATGGLLAFTTPIAARLSWLPRPVALATAATAGAQVAVTPLLLLAFGIVPGSTLIANVLAFPAVGTAFLGGSAASALALAWPSLGSAVGVVAALPIVYLEAVADRTARLALPSLVGTSWILPAIVAVVAYAALRRAIPRRSAALLVLLPFAVWVVAFRGAPPASLEVRFLDVGQGDAALVRTPDGATILVDAGPDEQEVATRLAALGIGRLDLVVASHAHQDHVEGLPAVFARHPVGLLFDPGCPADSPSHLRMLEAAGYEGVPVHHPRGGERLRLGALLIEVLGPDACAVDSPNDDSIVLRLTYGIHTVLFVGDAEVPAQLDLLDDGDPVQATVLKVPHHGSATSDPSFFEAVGASVAVVSVGENDYGHPVPETLEALRASGARVIRTDLAGEVTVTFGAGVPLVKSEASVAPAR